MNVERIISVSDVKKMESSLLMTMSLTMQSTFHVHC